ncbi:MAG: glycosyltransferase family 4 protein [Propionibacteriaceae bacterium]|nr:glycosyltransferase family 4 protein [Propionibacteriaceae bacterium]
MRIDFVADAVYPFHNGGKEKRLHDLATALVDQGHEVHVHTMHWWSDPAPTHVVGGVVMHALCRVHPLYAGDRRSIKQALLFSLACLRLARVPFEVLDVDHMPYFPLLTARIACGLRRKPLYATWHEALDADSWRRYMGPIGVIAFAIERITSRLPRAIGTASAQTRRNLASHHRRTRGVRLVGTGVDLDTIATTQPAAEPTDILFVGRLVKDKQVALLLDAMALIRAQRPGTTCTIIGRGIEEDRLRAQVERLGLGDAVRMIGWLAESHDVYAHMKSAKVFALPSNREGFGMVVAEALACGTPVVTIDSPENASQHLINPGVSGSVTANDPRAFADGLLEWLDRSDKLDPEDAGTLDLAWPSIAARQLEVYT